MPRIVIVLVCLAMVALLLMEVSWPIAPYCGLAALGLVIAALASFLHIRRQSRYDLGMLRELHESGGPPPEDDLPEVADDAGVVCPFCGTVYAAWMLICPNCKR